MGQVFGNATKTGSGQSSWGVAESGLLTLLSKRCPSSMLVTGRPRMQPNLEKAAARDMARLGAACSINLAPGAKAAPVNGGLP